MLLSSWISTLRRFRSRVSSSVGSSRRGSSSGGGIAPLEQSSTAAQRSVGGAPRRSISAQPLNADDTSDDDEGPDLHPVRRGLEDAGCVSAGGCGQNRRGGVELRRSQTFDGRTSPPLRPISGSARHSMSSSCDGSLDDQLRRLYGRVKACHRGRNALIMQGHERTTKRPVIIKAYSKLHMSESMKGKMDREARLLQHAATCPGVVRLLNMMEDGANKYLVLEHASGNTLIEIMALSGGRLREQACVAEVVVPLLRTLASLHALGVVHREVKPEHVVCGPGGAVRLVDFGAAADKATLCLNHRVGSLPYMAPEVARAPAAEEVFHHVLYHGMEESELPQYSEKVDVWSLGVMVFEALTGLQPFLAETRDELAEMHAALAEEQAALASGKGAVVGGGPQRQWPRLFERDALPPLARDFLAAALQVDPARRASADELLRMPWVTPFAALPPVPEAPAWMVAPPTVGPLPSIPSRLRLHDDSAANLGDPAVGNGGSGTGSGISNGPIDASVTSETDDSAMGVGAPTHHHHHHHNHTIFVAQPSKTGAASFDKVRPTALEFTLA